jgi:hypothetical protein
MALRHVLELPAGRFALQQFLKSEYSEENLDFWARVENFRNLGIMCQSVAMALEHPDALVDDTVSLESLQQSKITLSEKLTTAARDCVDTFVSASATTQININSRSIFIIHPLVG